MVSLVSLPYGFTLFSNVLYERNKKAQFHYLMDLHYSQTFTGGTFSVNGFTTLWIYTILKQSLYTDNGGIGFTTLWIYTILKLLSASVFAK